MPLKPELRGNPVKRRVDLASRLAFHRSQPQSQRLFLNLISSDLMALSVGSKAPDFTVSTLGASGPELFTLSEQVGKAPIVLLFVPMAFTGVCTKELCEISGGMNDYKNLNATVIAVSGDNPFAQKAWAEKENITIPLLSDYDHKVATAYGIAYDSFLPAKNLTMSGVAKRSAFVIDKAGVIQYAEVLESPGDVPNFEAVKAKLKELA